MIPFKYSRRNLLARRLTTFLTAGGIGLVVFVFSAVMMLAHGLEKALVANGSEDNAIVLRQGAETEIMSMISRDQAGIISSQPEIAMGPDGDPLAAAEVVVLINLLKQGTGRPSNLQVRGVASPSLLIRRQIELVEGRVWRPGTSEVIVGAAAAKRFQGVGLGDTVRFGMREWRVVGVFAAQGAAFESEIWLDAEQLIQAFRRPVFSSVTIRLGSPVLFDAFQQRLEADPRLTVQVRRERQYYADQSWMTATFIRVLGIFVTVIFSVGAMIGAMITMYAAVANRIVEIGTLRALGFPRRSILTVFLSESILLSLIGGGAGLFVASFLQALTFSTTNFTTFSEMAFQFSLSPIIILESMTFAMLMGLLGGFLPAVRAARQEIIQALRST